MDDKKKAAADSDFNPFSGEVQYTIIDNITYGVRAVFNGKETLSNILKRRILREYEQQNSLGTGLDFE